MASPLIVGNWKMNLGLRDALALAVAVGDAPVTGVQMVVCPPFPWLVPVRDALGGSPVALGAQNCASEPQGAHTGEVSAPMLAELCRFVIVGHSERRATYGETDPIIARKTRAVLEAGLTPIVCVGENLDQRQRGDAVAVVHAHLAGSLSEIEPAAIARCIVAYEPVWAIGTGVAATADDAAAMAAAIREWLVSIHQDVGSTLPILYGGSVTATNAAALLAPEDIGGALVGGASLDAVAFTAIAEAARR